MPKVEISFDETSAIPRCFDPNQSFFRDWVGIIKDGKVIGFIDKKLLEPRYTAAELEKITAVFENRHGMHQDVWEFLAFLKDQKRVQEILDA